MTIFIAFLASAFFYGEMGAFAIIKHPLAVDFGFSETFLGTSHGSQAPLIL